jgi:hypothetical protein
MGNVALHNLSRLDCLDRLALQNLGQLMTTRGALPAAVLTRYIVEQDHVLLHILAGLMPVSVREGDIVSLHVTAFEADQHSGWRVSITGRTHARPDLAVLMPADLVAPWIPDEGGRLLELSAEIVEGEQLDALD